MRKNFIAFAIFNLLVFNAYAQNHGDSRDAWDEKHRDEAAIVVYSSSATELNKGGSYTKSMRWIKRIQKENAKGYGEIAVGYNKKRQVIKKIEAYLVTADGEKYFPKIIQDIGTSKEGEYSDYRKKIITMNNVIPGCTIYFYAEKFNRYGPVSGEYSDLLAFYAAAPQKHTVEELAVPQDLKLFFKPINNPPEPVITRNGKKVVYRWEFKDDQLYDEKLSREENLPPLIECLPFLSISTMKDWDQFARWYGEKFSGNIIISKAIDETVKKITKNKTTATAKIMAISKYIHDNFRYVAMNLDDHDFQPHPADEVFNDKLGDCKDYTVLLITMLKQAGIEVYPALVHQSEQGDIRQLLPSTDYFYHLIAAVKIGNKLFFVDPLVKGYKPNEIPANLEKEYVLIVNAKGGRIIQLPFMNIAQKTNIEVNHFYLKPDGSAIIKGKEILDRRASIEIREYFKLASRKSKKDFFDRIENMTQGGKLIKYKIKGKNNEYEPIVIVSKSFNPRYLKPLGKIMILGNTAVNLTGSFNDKNRKYPLRLYGEWKEICINEYIIPKGFRVEYLPPDLNLSSPRVSVTVRYKVDDRVVRQDVRYHFKETTIPAAGYAGFKISLLNIERAMDESVVIKRE
jgi:transglutaminase-like putative cysteine protease